MNALQARYGYAWSEDDYAKGMRKGWGGGLSDGTPCGAGSTLEHTENVRAWLPKVIERYDILTLCDAGAGDLHWIKQVPLHHISYRAFDLVPRAPAVEYADISVDTLPPCDLILCRHVLNHMAPHRVIAALERFGEAAEYLIATHHPEGKCDLASVDAFNHWDLTREPFGLPEPLEVIDDCREHKLALWRLQ